ncbi:MAG: TIGR00282 family metallophosphoesterase [Pelagibacteraceae bacterium]|jgi:2',3'-cyclic-nucleotide 2'-phosphodiesterase|nr:TIGR00282 family metallophosphoesterase [Pelagibacteraceae bacterium]
MKILILGDLMGSSGRKSLQQNLSKIVKDKNIDFTIVNGENAAADGKGITKDIAGELFDIGIDVITSGNHIWDKKETSEFIIKEERLLRPENLISGSPGNGFGVFLSKDKKYKVAVINLMGNVFMKKTEDLFTAAKKLQNKIKLKEQADFIVVDLHGEITSEKMAMGHYFDGKATAVVGTHTHVPTADTRILDNGTAFQTDIGMCGDYNSVIGMNKENSIMKFLNNDKAVRHFPAEGQSTLSGIIVEGDPITGLANKVERFFYGGVLNN